MSDKVLSQFKQEAIEEKKAAGKKFKIGIIGTGWIAEARSTFPSTAGTGIPKLMDATAPAVYGPIPGRERSLS